VLYKIFCILVAIKLWLIILENIMKKTFAMLLVSLMFAMPIASQAAANATPITAAEAAADENYPYYLAAGAVAGVLVFNFITGGVEALPFVTSSVAGGTLWEGPLAVNRAFTAISAVLGTMAMDWSYKNLDVKTKPAAPEAPAAAPAVH
jgi:hypothetical protein